VYKLSESNQLNGFDLSFTFRANETVDELDELDELDGIYDKDE
jgi:hypothetical protein